MLNYITKKGASSAQRLGVVGTCPLIHQSINQSINAQSLFTSDKILFCWSRHIRDSRTQRGLWPINRNNDMACHAMNVLGMTLNCIHTDIHIIHCHWWPLWYAMRRPVKIFTCTVLFEFIYKSLSDLFFQQFLALIAFLCWCALKQSVNQAINVMQWRNVRSGALWRPTVATKAS